MIKAYPIIIGVIVFFTFLGGINGQFQFDDYPNIVQNERLHIKTLAVESITRSAFSGSSGILRRPISMMSFAINHYFSNLNPFSYKATNLAIHIVNCIGIYWICLQLLNSVTTKYIISKYNIALIVSLAWGTHPVNLTAVLYVVQRMTSLGMMFTIAAIALYLKAHQVLHENHFRKGLFYLLLVVIFGLLGILSKENSALLFLYLFIIEWALYKETKRSERYNKIITSFFVVFLLTPLLIISTHTINNPDWILSGYNVTDFSLYERGLTELRILWIYIYWILIPNNSNLGFFHDDITLSTSIIDSTIPLIYGIGHILVIGTIVYLWKKQQKQIFVLGVSLFYASHLIESTILPLMLTFEHRNYFGSFGIILAISSLLFNNHNNKNKHLVVLATSIYICILSILTIQRASTWGFGINNALVDIQHHPDSAAANYELARQYSILKGMENNNKAKLHFIKAAELDEKRADPLFALIMLSARNNELVNNDVLMDLRHRLISSPVYASHVTWMGSIVKCYMNNLCLINQDEIVDLIEAALSNNKINKVPLLKSYYLMIAADLLANKGNNYKQALYFSILSANTSPDEVKFTINLINIALAYKDHSTASSWITKLDNKFSGLYPQEVEDLRQRNKEPININK